jgi:hypothetical protein
MIAPDEFGGKRFARGLPEPCKSSCAGSSTNASALLAMRQSRLKSRGCGIFDQRNHGFVRPIIKRPYFGQSRAKLNCEMYIVASGPDPDRIPDSSAPQPPGVWTDRARVSAYGSIPNMLKAGLSPAFFLNAFLPRMISGETGDERPHRSCVAGSLTSVVCRATGAKAAPRMMPGFSCEPCCTSTAAPSMSSPRISAVGTFQTASAPA